MADRGEDRVLTIPNVITVVRLLCIPVFLWLLFDQHKRAEAAFLLLAALGARRIDVQWAGKAGTFGLMFAFPLFLMGHDQGFSPHRAAEFLAWCCAIPALCLAWYAAITYIPMARRALKEGRVASTTE